MIETYLFRIEHIAPDYSFYSSHSRWDEGPYGEYAHTKIDGSCLVPAKLAGRATRFTFFGDRAVAAMLEHPNQEAAPANGIGTLTMRGVHSEYLGSMPFDVLLGLAPTIVAGGLRFITLVGPPLYRGTSRISSVSFLANADPEDY